MCLKLSDTAIIAKECAHERELICERILRKMIAALQIPHIF